MVTYVTIKVTKTVSDKLKNEVDKEIKRHHPDLKFTSLSYNQRIEWIVEYYLKT